VTLVYCRIASGIFTNNRETCYRSLITAVCHPYRSLELGGNTL